MAFSTSGDYSATATDIITEALEILGVLEEGEAPSTAQSTSSLRSLNYLIKLWGADNQVWAQAEYTLDLVADTGTYTLDVNNVGYTPQRIITADLLTTATNEERSINILTRSEWESLSDKTTSGPPVNLWSQRLVEPNGMTLKIWPVPADTTYDINLWLQLPLRDVDAGTDDMYCTQEWYLPFVYGLAYILSSKYGISEQEKTGLFQTAENFRWEAESFQTDGDLSLQPDLGG